MDVLACKIGGLRTVIGGEATSSYSDDWTRVIKIEGCDYRVPENMILTWLRQYGEVLSELVEDVFEDNEDSEGTNATGIYSVKMKLIHNIPQLLPMAGRRIKIYYRGIQKLCTRCFGPHIARNCTANKAPWLNYVRSFIESNPEVDSDLFGKWIPILEREKDQGVVANADQDQASKNEKTEQKKMTPTVTNPEKNSGEKANHKQGTAEQVSKRSGEEDKPNQSIQPHQQDTENSTAHIQTEQNEPLPGDYNIPVEDAKQDKLISRMMNCGVSYADAVANIEKRKKLFDQAVKKYVSAKKSISKKGRQIKPRKNSLNNL